MIWTGTLPPPPPPPSHTIPSSTLRSNFQPGDTGEAQFSNLFFLLVGTVVYVGVLGHHRFQRGSWETNRDFGPLDARVFRGVPPSPLPPPLGPDLCLPPPPPSLILLTLPPPPYPATPPHKRITWVPERAKRGSMARGRWRRVGRSGELFKITLSRPRNAYTPLRHPLSCPPVCGTTPTPYIPFCR